MTSSAAGARFASIISGWRRIPSRIANWLMAKLSGVDIHDFGTTFKAYRREILEQSSALWRVAPLHSSSGFVVRRLDLRSSHPQCEP